jgi:hypothetical protein
MIHSLCHRAARSSERRCSPIAVPAAAAPRGFENGLAGFETRKADRIRMGWAISKSACRGTCALAAKRA